MAIKGQTKIKVTPEALDEMINRATEPLHDVAALALSNKLPFIDDAALVERRDSLETMVANWQGRITKNKAEVCIKLAERSVLASEGFHFVLDEAVRFLMPPYLANDRIFRAIDAANKSSDVREVAKRFNKCRKFESSSYVFRFDEDDGKNSSWYKILKIVGEQIMIQSPDDRKNTRIESLPCIVSPNMTFFSYTAEISGFFSTFAYLSKISVPGTDQKRDLTQEEKHEIVKTHLKQKVDLTNETCVATLQRNALIPLSEDEAQNIIRHTTGWNLLSDDEFNAWWGKSAVVATAPKDYFEARSLQELYDMLPTAKGPKESTEREIGQDVAKLTEINPEIVKKIFAILAKVSPLDRPNPQFSDMTAPNIRATYKLVEKNEKLLAACLAVLAEIPGSDDDKYAMFEALCNPETKNSKVGFWPDNVHTRFSHDELDKLDTWANLPAKALPGFVDATQIFYKDSPEKLVTLAFQLPEKCLNVFYQKKVFEMVDLEDFISSEDVLPCDLILWIFKHQKELSKKIVSAITMDVCIHSVSVSQEDLPLEWLAAQRELRKLMFTRDPRLAKMKEDKNNVYYKFKEMLIENAEGNFSSITNAWDRYGGFAPTEKQSVRVFYSDNEVFKAYVEALPKEEEEEEIIEDTLFSSIQSIKKLNDEYEDIVNVQIPKNTEAKARAREMGDLRENAEWDAAKDREKYLNGRKKELERELHLYKPTDFKDVEITNRVVLGCMVTLVPEGEEPVTYALLGIADGNPDLKRLSFNSPLGKAIRGKRVGSVAVLAFGNNVRKFTIQSVEALPESLRKELAGETAPAEA